LDSFDERHKDTRPEVEDDRGGVGGHQVPGRRPAGSWIRAIGTEDTELHTTEARSRQQAAGSRQQAAGCRQQAAGSRR
jgi:hypothetical protein